jgi:hypothetical protein
LVTESKKREEKVEAIMDTSIKAKNLSVKPKPSKKVSQSVKRIDTAYGKLENLVMMAYNQAMTEGFSPQDAKKLIFEKHSI